MEAVLDQSPLTNPEWELEKSQKETNHVQHEHDPGRVYEFLQSAVYREINMETLSGLHRHADSEVTDRARQIPAALLVSPGHQVNSSYSWTQSYTCEGSRTSSSTQPHSLSTVNGSEPKK